MKTIADQCRESLSLIDQAAKRQIYKGMPDPFKKIFHFVDGSYLSFRVNYEPVETGVLFPCPQPNTI